MLRRKKRKESKAESFILISYGFSFSLPILIFSLSFTIGQLIDFEKSEKSLGNLKEVKDGSSIFTALLLSFVSFVSLVHHHNEKKTDKLRDSRSVKSSCRVFAWVRQSRCGR